MPPGTTSSVIAWFPDPLANGLGTRLYMYVLTQGVVTPICTVLTAKTVHLDPYTKEGVESLLFLLLGQRTKCV